MKRDPHLTRTVLTNAFLDGLTRGFASPFTVFSRQPTKPVRPASLHEIWRDVGDYIRASAAEHFRDSNGKSQK